MPIRKRLADGAQVAAVAADMAANQRVHTGPCAATTSPMELALEDIRRHLDRLLAPIAGVPMLLTIVPVMNGHCQGDIQGGVWLIDNAATELRLVERGRGGPFNEASRIPLVSDA